MKRKLLILLSIIAVVILITGCRQRDRVSHNLSQEADAFNITRKLSVINQRTDTLLFQMTGNFAIQTEDTDELSVVGENDDGTYYKHFIYLSDEISYIVEDLGKTSVNKRRYEINLNPQMIIPFEPTAVD